MTRKDTILIAVIINTGLLAVLFATAIIYDSDSDVSQSDNGQPLAEAVESFPEATSTTASASAQTVDEVDNVLKYYSQPTQVSVAAEQQPENFSMQQTPVNASSAFEENYSPPVKAVTTTTSSQEDSIDVTVKKGDSLDKIAKANGTTVAAIKKASNLQNDKLSIGQVLKIPVKKDNKQAKSIAKAAETKETAAGDAVFYTVKSGDSPWKIAKQFNVSTDDILKLNNLDEAKARNLKAGDRIRVK